MRYHVETFLSAVLFITTTFDTACSQDGPLVKTRNGPVRGKRVTDPNGKHGHAYLGIPYGKPPTGQLRFSPPLPSEPWEEEFNASSNSIGCIQYIVPLLRRLPAFHEWLPGEDMREDCLRLDVWTPSPQPHNATVMVYIYGGAFSMGATNIPAYNPLLWCTEQGVIFVTMNYRVASFGFLYFNHSDTPGNVGLLDQVLALQWIQNNIEYFGGNPRKVTLFGQSAGGASVGFHLLSPVSKDLFNNAILQSGTQLSDWATQSKEENIGYGLKLAEFTGCPRDPNNVSAILQCLREFDAEELVQNEPFRGFDSNIFRPVIDGYFVTGDPLVLAQNGSFKSTEVLIGSVKNEGTHFLVGLMPIVFQPITNDIKPKESDLRELISLATRFENPLLIEAIQFHYTNYRNKSDPANILYGAEKMFGDYYFTCGINQFARSYAETGNPVYQYYFTHRSSNDIKVKWIGTHHGHDLIYVFGHPIRKKGAFLKSEVVFTRRIMDYWANFARTGDPNRRADGQEISIRWPRYTPDRSKYLVLAPNSTAVGSSFRHQQCAFWDEFFPYLKRELENTTR